MSRISKAHMFAAGAHGGVGQKRKYTGEDYINHPVAVREIVAWHGGTVEMQIAALLHDVVEDTHVTIEMVRGHFGEHVAEMVLALTNIARPEDGNRIQRFIINVRELVQRESSRKSAEKANQKNNYAVLTACLSKVWRVCSAQWI